MELSPLSTEGASPLSLPPCFPPLNTAWFDSVNKQLDAINNSMTADEAELQRLVDQVYNGIALINSSIQSQLAYIEPILALATAPTDPAEVITWITNFISGFLGPYVLPYTKFATQSAQLATEVSTMTARIEGIATNKHWTIAIPPVDPFCSV